MKAKKGNYISIGESRKIIKYNVRQMKYYEKRKRRNVAPEEYTCVMRDERNLIEIDGLKTCFFTDNGTVMSVNGVSFDIPRNKILGVVGESGCGKSVTSLSLMQLVQAPQGQIIEGEIRYNTDALGRDGQGRKLAYNIAAMPMKEMYKIRGKDITMIFQEPMTSLNPVFTIGYQLDEVSFLHVPDTTKEKAKAYSIELLKKVGISMPEHTYKSYPHELSGGMRQRVMIAMAIAGNPKLLIADEPTTALDVTIQAQILELLRDLQKKQECSIMLITHDLGVIAEMADEVVIMYAGKVIEKGTAQDIFHNPLHPYTVGLQKSKPLITSDGNEPLYSIPGQVPNPINLPDSCYFKGRCNRVCSACGGTYPPMVQVSDTHAVACYLYSSEKAVQHDGK
ncbi:MAG: ABC transporter ATP-binding protein, partial [Clostridiales bacterium]|nr:ABC transporter ATP-binding protein [Clostridiales bacterium]